MGRAKQRFLELEARGFGEVPEKYVCEYCFKDDGLTHYIRNHGAEGQCSYCYGDENTDQVVSLENILVHIMQSLRYEEWYDPADSGTPYETREGGWLVDQYEIDDIIIHGNYPIECEHDGLQDDIMESIGHIVLLPFFSMPDPLEGYMIAWDDFCRRVKYEAQSNGDNEQALDDPTSILDTIAHFVNGIGLVRTFPTGTPLVRVALEDTEKHSDVGRLASPPRHKAKYSNRMSPAGIPMFYGAEDEDTAIAETMRADRPTAMASIATFETLEDFHILDLVDLPPLPSIYHEDEGGWRTPLRFLQDFSEDIAKPIVKDGREHIEYVPTQIVTEYFKLLHLSDGMKIDGIRYRSAQHDGGICYVLFVENEECVDGRLDASAKGGAKLSLVNVAHKQF